MVKKTTVKAKYLRISPKKVIPYLKKYRNLTIDRAEERCLKINNKAARLIAKLIKSAVSAAEDKDIDRTNVVIDSLVCQSGPVIKRQLIRSRGRSDIIKKRTSHLLLTVREQIRSKKVRKKDGKEDQRPRKK